MRPSQQEVDDYLKTLKSSLMGQPLTFQYNGSDDAGGTLYIHGSAPIRERDSKDWLPFLYALPHFQPESIDHLRLTLAHLLAEFAAHEVLEHFYEGGHLVIDTHEEGVLCVTTGPLALGFSTREGNRLSPLVEFPAVAPQSG